MKKSPIYFRYPPNLNTLDLANIISLYRSRGEPADATAGDYFGCAATFKLIKKAKTWFGLYYSQQAWDSLLTKDCVGYPLTEVELNILGMAYLPPEAGVDRTYIEKKCGTLTQLAFLIVNDLKQFGFLEEEEEEGGRLTITHTGEKALNGIALRLFEKRFNPEMLLINRDADPTITKAQKKENNQKDLF
ncbi:MAG: hypothetical protein WD267_11715 [Balneolales bacterium]